MNASTPKTQAPQTMIQLCEDGNIKTVEFDSKTESGMVNFKNKCIGFCIGNPRDLFDSKEELVDYLTDILGDLHNEFDEVVKSIELNEKLLKTAENFKG
jgi:hypothetical protein